LQSPVNPDFIKTELTRRINDPTLTFDILRFNDDDDDDGGDDDDEEESVHGDSDDDCRDCAPSFVNGITLFLPR